MHFYLPTFLDLVEFTNGLDLTVYVWSVWSHAELEWGWEVLTTALSHYQA